MVNSRIVTSIITLAIGERTLYTIDMINTFLLGWSANSWDNNGQLPDTEDMFWDELTPKQQAATTQLCYFRDLWDSVLIYQIILHKTLNKYIMFDVFIIIIISSTVTSANIAHFA